VPSLLSVTVFTVPLSVEITTAPPVEVKFVPFACFKRTVIVEVDVPLAIILVGVALIKEVIVEAATGTDPQIDILGVPEQSKVFM
jgi:hypothetical protein